MVTDAQSVAADGDTFVRDMLRDTARKFFANRERAGAEAWAEIAAMGWTGITVPEAQGGAGLSLADQAVVFEELGRALYSGPYFSSVALAGPCLEAAPEALERLLAGSATFTLAWAEPDGPTELTDLDAVTCRAEERDGSWALFGVKSAVPDLPAVDEVVVAARAQDGVGLFLVRATGDGATVEPEPSVDAERPDGRLVLDGAAAERIASPEAAGAIAARVRAGALVAASYEALGLGERVLQVGVEYACDRQQFGKAIGSFQAIAGPLAERYVQLQLAGALAEWARVAVERGDGSADVAAAAARAAATEAAIDVAETTIQVLGGIGFTWEHPAHEYLRRALWLNRFEGTPERHRAAVARALLDPATVPRTVELLDDAEAARFRAEVRAWIDAHLPTDRRGLALIQPEADYDRVRRDWQQAMMASGNLVAHWPAEFGGRDAAPIITAIFREEAIAAHPRVSHGDGGVDLVAPLLIEHGTREQQERFLDAIRTETEIWGQGFSEPDAGSDLAALKTRATRDGDDWVLNGSKTWTTYAPFAQWLFLLARTDPEASRHRGITCFIVDAKAPGVEIRPIVDIAGDEEFGEVFLTDVRVPPENVLGGVNEGWGVAVMTLANERVIESCEDVGEADFMFDRLLDCIREVEVDGSLPADDPLVRDSVARLWTEFQAVRLVLQRSLVALTSSDVPPDESSIVKLAWSEIGQRAARLGAELFGGLAHRGGRERDIARFWEHTYLTSRSFTIYAGTSEILRSVIAERVLGLPRSR